MNELMLQLAGAITYEEQEYSSSRRTIYTFTPPRVERAYLPSTATIKWHIFCNGKSISLDKLLAQCEQRERARKRARRKQRAAFRRRKRGLV